ncbi:methyltransferase, TIGR04325 family [Edaphobacter flagellatus]|uniref:methyltransferase, TIGR04325 family n=1 Tax=Edaphobacter flagellatus TaxID=1933044 RepID=UPI0021B2F2E7|nr:methyltransferase, TIGR04325 family [Edaphobacter flagellatus]
MEEVSSLTRLRFQQVRLTAHLCARLSRFGGTRSLFQTLGKNNLLEHALLGFNSIFPSFEAAKSYAKRYKVASHEHPGNTAVHLELNQAPRPSDYPVLFHMQNLLPEVHSVVDIGGSAGNLFYCYDRYLHFDPQFSWTVNDMPANNRIGARIAGEHHESRLHFVDELADCEPVDMVLISGALHYFELLPPEMMRALKRPPRHVIINRTPVIEGETTITIQDAGFYYAISPARLLSRKALMQSMSDADYEVVDEWTVPDLHFDIPLHPECSARYYSGFYFRLRSPENRPAREN